MYKWIDGVCASPLSIYDEIIISCYRACVSLCRYTGCECINDYYCVLSLSLFMLKPINGCVWHKFGNWCGSFYAFICMMFFCFFSFSVGFICCLIFSPRTVRTTTTTTVHFSITRNIVAFQLFVVVVRTSTYTLHVPVCCCNLYSIWLLQYSNASNMIFSLYLCLYLSVCIRNKCYINVYFSFASRFSTISCFPFPSMCKCVVKHTPNAICVRQTERDQAHTAKEEIIYICIYAHTLFTL